ncbi:hypothetical protein EIN_186820 [Entamoeba invadens IP1]|uniref:hypothetical protein n=1 Tax=Entamoeba invadens IP1 TaxID=370355 RepID=UPI0002C3F4E5|nr:hypothetical protein EIN_186820 [Entamoeba invadens IP1]ELP94245.1 hypothetical protein EIN_186820 [Entamoeba invadens IP1]|eukprot:XP_004261016.1 hypothetical protein EIN_186820 [Entamoeba invadens IP1]
MKQVNEFKVEQFINATSLVYTSTVFAVLFWIIAFCVAMKDILVDYYFLFFFTLGCIFIVPPLVLNTSPLLGNGKNLKNDGTHHEKFELIDEKLDGVNLTESQQMFDHRAPEPKNFK